MLTWVEESILHLPIQVLGGTGYVNEWSTEVWQKDHDAILERCTKMMPSLAEVCSSFSCDPFLRSLFGMANRTEVEEE